MFSYENFPNYHTREYLLFHQVLWISQALIRNTYCGPVQEMCAAPSQSPRARMLTGVVVHAVLTFLSRDSADILQPFIKMLNTPGELKVIMPPKCHVQYLHFATSAFTIVQVF